MIERPQLLALFYLLLRDHLTPDELQELLGILPGRGSKVLLSDPDHAEHARRAVASVEFPRERGPVRYWTGERYEEV